MQPHDATKAAHSQHSTLHRPPRARPSTLHFLLIALALLCGFVLGFHTAAFVRPPAHPHDDLLAVYHPLNNDRVHSLHAVPCDVRLPTLAELEQWPFSAWPVSRFAAYFNIYHFLKGVWDKPGVRVLDLGGSLFLAPFNRTINITRSTQSSVDVHATDFAPNTFDAIAADQVLEHVTFPHLAMLEMRRILKPGGLAILTTVAYNPEHEAPSHFHDYWRFMLDGLRVLSAPFEGGVKVCGSWGDAAAVATRAQTGMGSEREKAFMEEQRERLLTNNDDVNSFIVWIVVQK